MTSAQRHAVEEMWRKEDLEDVRGCPACGRMQQRRLYSDLRDQVFEIAGGRWSMLLCGFCASVFLSPRPAPHALKRAYAGGYYTHAPVSDGATGGQAISGVALRGRNAYLNRRYGLSLSPASLGSLLVTGLNPRLRAAQARQVRHLRLPRPGAELLDVGCGNGAFVAQAHALGWHARGIDIDETAVEAGRAMGLPLAVCTIDEEVTMSSGRFDAVTMEHVLEHVPDPLAFLRAARALLRPGGALWLATPNVDSSGHRRFGPSWKHLDPPRHLVILSGKMLDELLRTAGFASVVPLTSASGTIATYVHSSLIDEGRSPLGTHVGARSVVLRGSVAGLRALLQRSTAEELVRVARTDS